MGYILTIAVLRSMSITKQTEQDKAWTISEAKTHLSEILRLATEVGPQRIGTRKSYVVIPESQWRELSEPKQPLGQWLVENMPRVLAEGDELELPTRVEPEPDNPFI